MDNSRRFNRVNVQLPVSIRQENAEIFLSKTLDISEGGILVKDEASSQLKAGDLVEVHIDGILSEENGKTVLHKMKVARIEDDIIALEFL